MESLPREIAGDILSRVPVTSLVNVKFVCVNVWLLLDARGAINRGVCPSAPSLFFISLIPSGFWFCSRIASFFFTVKLPNFEFHFSQHYLSCLACNGETKVVNSVSVGVSFFQLERNVSVSECFGVPFQIGRAHV